MVHIYIYIYIQYLFSRENQNRYRPETLRTQFILFELDITLLTSCSQDMFVRRLLLRIVHSVSTYSTVYSADNSKTIREIRPNNDKGCHFSYQFRIAWEVARTLQWPMCGRWLRA